MQAWLRLLKVRPRWRSAALVSALVIALIGLTAGPASAIVVRLANGKEISYEAVSGASAPRLFDDVFQNVDYNGGPVMPSNTNYLVVWEPHGYLGAAFQSAYTGGVAQFFTDLAAASGQSTNADSVATQYNDAPNFGDRVAAYDSHFGGTLTDTDPLPANGCPPGLTGICITDAQIQTELSKFLSAYPRDLQHEYFLLTPPGVASCMDATGDGCSLNYNPPECVSQAISCFCAYHSAVAGSNESGPLIYANIPDLAGGEGCDPFVTHGPGFCLVSTCRYNNGPADGVLSAVQHEHAESITDPEPNNGWTDWSDEDGPEEMADKCNNDAFSDPHLVTQQSGSTDTPYNYTINGHHYLLQMLWSNQGHGCTHSWAPNGTMVHASFTQTATSGDSISFDADGSTPIGENGIEYVWQFNDGSGQQTNTFETASPTTSWRFPSVADSPATGYVVALTVMAPDGTSDGTAHTVWAVDHGPNAAFTRPTAYAGIPTAFNGGATTDPNPGSGIVSYSWDFGDGTRGSGELAAHTYKRLGHYTVMLTVEDNYYAAASVSEKVTVSKAPPRWFSPVSGLSRQTIHFRLTSLAPHGTGYSWRFGDGTTGHGPHPTHRYTHAGTHLVTLTVTTGHGHTRSVTIPVAIMPSCRVPNVEGDSLAAATRALRAAGCRLGAVKHHGRSVVTREHPAAGAIVALGVGVALTF